MVKGGDYFSDFLDALSKGGANVQIGQVVDTQNNTFYIDGHTRQQKDVDTSALSTPEAEAIWECLRVNNVVDGRNRAEAVWKDAVVADEMGDFLHITNKWVVFPAYWGCSPNLRNNMTQKQVGGRDATEDIKSFRKKVRRLLRLKPMG